MRLNHPVAPYQGIAPEDVLFVSNDQQIQMGSGHVYMFNQFEMYPERPVHIYMQIDAQPAARAMLFGALLARAQQLRVMTPNLPARVYAQLDPTDLNMLSFYAKCGFANDDGEDLFTFAPPEGVPRAPMGMQFASVPLQDQASQAMFLQRINAYRIQPVTMDYLTLWMQQQHFMAVGFYRQGNPVCELIVAGTGDSATLVMIYTRSDMRRQGMAKQLMSAAGGILRDQGVTTLYTHIFRRNASQVGLMKHLNANFVRTVFALPGMDI